MKISTFLARWQALAAGYKASPLQRVPTSVMSPNLTKCFAKEIKLRYYCDEKFIVVANSNNTGSDNSFSINQLLIK